MARAVEWIAWLCVIVALWLWQGFGPANPAISFVAGGTSILFGVRVFLWHGRSRITVLGLFNLASVMFVGASGIYAASDPQSRVANEYLTHAILTATLLMVLVSMFAWGKSKKVVFRPAGDSVCWWLIGCGVGALLVLSALKSLGMEALAPWLEASAYTSIVVFAVGVLLKNDARLFSAGMFGIALSFVMYTFVFHTGGGRLRIVALACTLAMLVTIRFPYRIIKPAMIAAVPLALFFLAQQRLTLQEEISGSPSGNNGLESMLVPIIVLALLFRAQDRGLPYDLGENFLSIPAAFLPEAWVPNAPEAIGYALVPIQNPGLVGTGFSTAGTLAGEHVYSFGLAGVVLIAPVVGLIIRAFDYRIVTVANRAFESRRAALSLVFWTAIAGAVADLAWAGTHIFVMRTVQRLPVWLLLLLPAAMRDGLEGGRGARFRRISKYGPRARTFEGVGGESRRLGHRFGTVH